MDHKEVVDKPGYKLVRKNKSLLKSNSKLACKCGKVFDGFDKLIQKSFNTDLCETCYTRQERENSE